MFRKATLLAAVCSLVLLVPMAHAAKGDVRLSLVGGLSAPMGDFSKKLADGGAGASMGFNIGPSLDYMVTEAVAIGVDGSFTSNSLNSDERDALRTAFADDQIDLKYTTMGGGAHVKYFFPMASSPINPYLLGGVGMTSVKIKATDSTGSIEDSESKFGGRFGVGFGYKTSGQVGFGLEGAYNIVSTEGSSLTWVGVNAVLTFGLSKPK